MQTVLLTKVKTNKVKKIYGKDTEADTEIAEDDVPMESNSSDVKSVETTMIRQYI